MPTLNPLGGNYMPYKDIKSLLEAEFPEKKVWSLPKNKLDYFNAHKNDGSFNGYELEEVSIDDLIRDNDLDNPITLNNHPETWSPTQSEDDIHPDKLEYKADLDTSPSDIIYGSRLANGKIRIGNGRHRTRALKNGGYTHLNIPIFNDKK